MKALPLLLLSLVAQMESPEVRETAGDSDRQAAEQLAFMKESASAFRISLGGDKADESTEESTLLTLRPEPILRTSNAMGRSNGGLFMWTLDGRPAAVLEMVFFTKQKRWMYNFQSLAQQGLSAKKGDQHIWTPATAGVELQPIEASASPHETRSRRLRQMKSIAHNFSATVTTNYSGKNALRLLPQPLYRYEKADEDLLDGAVFAMVLGTSAELLVLVEARKSPEGLRWHYGLAPLNPCETVARYKETQVWSVPFRPHPQPINKTFFSYRNVR